MDERENLPSISQFEAMKLCSARWHMSQKVGEPPANPDAQYGRQVHAALETGDIEDLTPAQIELMGDMLDQEKALMGEIFGKEIIAEFYREKRFWYQRRDRKDVAGGWNMYNTKIFSGKLDFAAWAHSTERVSLYIDYKSLWGETTPPAHNMQLRGGAVLMKQNFGSRRAFVAIVQPTKHRYALAAEYGPEDLDLAEYECQDLIRKSIEYGNSQFATPGPEQCRYCIGKLICEVAHKESVEQLSVSHSFFPNGLESCNDAALDILGNRWEIAKIIGEAIESEIRRRKEADPASMPNYVWKDSGHTSEIGKPGLVWPKFSYLLTAEEFSNACRVSKTALEQAVHNRTGQTMKDSKQIVENLLGLLLIRKPKKPSLQRKPYYEINK